MGSEKSRVFSDIISCSLNFQTTVGSGLASPEQKTGSNELCSSIDIDAAETSTFSGASE